MFIYFRKNFLKQKKKTYYYISKLIKIIIIHIYHFHNFQMIQAKNQLIYHFQKELELIKEYLQYYKLKVYQYHYSNQHSNYYNIKIYC